MRLKTGGVADIEINNRFQRDVYMVGNKLTSGIVVPFFPIKDIVTGQKIYLMYHSFVSVGMFGPLDSLFRIDQKQSDLYMTEHNEFILNKILEYKNKEGKDDPNGIADYANYYLIDGLVVFNKSVEEYKASNFTIE